MNRVIATAIFIFTALLVATVISSPSTSEAQALTRSYDELQQNKQADANVKSLRQLEKIADVLQDISSTLNDIESNQRKIIRELDGIKRKVD